MGLNTMVSEAVSSEAKKSGLTKEDLGKGGFAVALLLLLFYFGRQTIEQQKDMTKAINDGNVAMQQMAESSRTMGQQVGRAVDEMAKATASMNARE